VHRARPNAAIRRLYFTPRWRALRAAVLLADRACVVCQAAPSTIADHLVPHRGDPALFWNRDNLQGLCATCHSRKTRRDE